MKLNISFPNTGAHKTLEVDEEKKLRIFYEKRIAQEVPADALGDEWKGYILRITGGNDKQGFPMKQGILTNGRVRLLLSAGHSCYRPRCAGERKRKSVRGCIVDSNLSAISLIIVKKGDQEIEGLTDAHVPRRLGPKRASRIRRLFNLTKDDDVRDYVIRRSYPEKEKNGKKVQRVLTPKIQRLITPRRIQRKRKLISDKLKRRVKRREAQATYQKKLTLYSREQHAAKVARRHSSASVSHSDRHSVSKK